MQRLWIGLVVGQILLVGLTEGQELPSTREQWRAELDGIVELLEKPTKRTRCERLLKRGVETLAGNGDLKEVYVAYAETLESIGWREVNGKWASGLDCWGRRDGWNKGSTTSRTDRAQGFFEFDGYGPIPDVLALDSAKTQLESAKARKLARQKDHRVAVDRIRGQENPAPHLVEAVATRERELEEARTELKKAELEVKRLSQQRANALKNWEHTRRQLLEELRQSRNARRRRLGLPEIPKPEESQ